MRILNRLGGIELADAYACIKAISKKKASTIDAFKDQFQAGAMQRGLKLPQAEELWELIQKFAGYGFNKSHSTAYSLIAYMTAYLKAHYPVEFMAALLSGDIDNRNFKRKDSLVEHLEDCRRLGIEITRPDVNRSGIDFTVQDGTIVFGLSAIKSCGGGTAETIVANRQQQGPFHDLFDFCERIDSSVCHRATLETLIKAGAFDSTGARRSQLMAMVDRALQAGTAAAVDRRSGQRSLFAEFQTKLTTAAVALPDIPEWQERQRLAFEKEVLGFYLSSHPLAEFAEVLDRVCPHTTDELCHRKEGSEIYLGGMISALKLSHVKKVRQAGEPTKYAMFDLEDMRGVVRCLMWPNDYERYGALLEPDVIRVVRAVIDRRGGGDEVNLVVKEVLPLDELQQRCAKRVRIRIDESEHTVARLKQLREVVTSFPGNCELQLELALRDGSSVSLTSHALRVDGGSELRERVGNLLSPGALEVTTEPLKPATTRQRSRAPR
jgi:DNA polymerase-3 subunit alpha